MDTRNRITPENITELKENEIFTFGSNLAGRHFAGAANLARLKFGALVGVGMGFQNRSYALPTKDYQIQTLPLNEIQEHVDDYIDFVKRNPYLIFLTTKIGCGLASLRIEDIAPMFQKAKEIENIHLPREFWYYLEPFYGDNF